VSQKRLSGEILHLAVPSAAPLFEAPLAQFFEQPRTALRLYDACLLCGDPLAALPRLLLYRYLLFLEAERG